MPSGGHAVMDTPWWIRRAKVDTPCGRSGGAEVCSTGEAEEYSIGGDTPGGEGTAQMWDTVGDKASRSKDALCAAQVADTPC